MAEATDARLSTSLPGHPKTKKLARRLGAAGPLGCIYLFLWTAANRSDGDLSGMTDEDIELAVDWTGDDGAFVATMMDVGFLEGATCARRVHDWAEHNPWAAGAGDRSQRSKFAAACRDYGRARAEAMYPEYVAKLAADAPKTSAKGPADGENSTGGDAVTSSGSSIKQYKDDLTDESGSCPTPFPSDTDTLPPHFTQEQSTGVDSSAAGDEPAAADGDLLGDKVQGGKRRAVPACPHDEIIASYMRILPECPVVRVWSEPRRRHMQTRWKADEERQTVEWWDGLFEFIRRSDYLMGKVNGFQISLPWLVKSEENLAKVLEGNYHGARP